jgi:hypothetical protein
MAQILRTLVVLLSLRRPEGADFDWEEFDAAIAEDDCFGAHCEGASGALFMMQGKITKTLVKDQIEASKQSEEESNAMSDLSMQDLMDAVESEDGGSAPGLALVQTDASIERVSTASGQKHIFGAVAADGSIELNSQKETVVPSNGMMSISVDSHGDLHSEEGFMLVQTKTQIDITEVNSGATISEGDSSVAQDSSESVEEGSELEENLIGTTVAGHPSWTIEAMEEFAAVSLMQTDAQVHRNTVASVNADGTIDVSENKAEVPRDGMMHVSVDATGHFHYEI